MRGKETGDRASPSAKNSLGVHQGLSELSVCAPSQTVLPHSQDRKLLRAFDCVLPIRPVSYHSER